MFESETEIEDIYVRANQKLKLRQYKSTKMKLYNYTDPIFTRYLHIYKKNG